MADMPYMQVYQFKLKPIFHQIFAIAVWEDNIFLTILTKVQVWVCLRATLLTWSQVQRMRYVRVQRLGFDIVLQTKDCLSRKSLEDFWGSQETTKHCICGVNCLIDFHSRQSRLFSNYVMLAKYTTFKYQVNSMLASSCCQNCELWSVHIEFGMER